MQQAFTEANGVTYPLISDIDATTMIALGILNEEVGEDEPDYGIPHPGVFIVNPDYEIVGKVFIRSVSERVGGEGTLRYALEVLD